MARHHDDDGDGVANQAEPDWVGGCLGEDRTDPASWDDPEIAEPWADPPEIEPADDRFVEGLPEVPDVAR